MKRHAIRRSLFILVLGAMALAPAAARADEKVFQKVLPGAAWVHVDMGNGFTSFGSGVLVDAEKRWVLTNFHVVRDKTNAKVFFPVKKKGELVAERDFYVQKADTLAISGRVIFRKESSDLAVIELERLPVEAEAVKVASASAKPGQMIHLIGNPFVEPALWLYSTGKVRGVYPVRVVVGDPKAKDPFRMFLNCRIVSSMMPSNPGESGGMVVNDQGELIGIHSNKSVVADAVAYHIDLTEIRDVLRQVRADQPPAGGSLLAELERKSTFRK